MRSQQPLVELPRPVSLTACWLAVGWDLTERGEVMATYDLAALWEAHCRYEFETRDVDATMSTMVAEPYVNHIPTMTGGVGSEACDIFTRAISSG